MSGVKYAAILEDTRRRAEAMQRAEEQARITVRRTLSEQLDQVREVVDAARAEGLIHTLVGAEGALNACGRALANTSASSSDLNAALRSLRSFHEDLGSRMNDERERRAVHAVSIELTALRASLNAWKAQDAPAAFQRAVSRAEALIQEILETQVTSTTLREGLAQARAWKSQLDEVAVVLDDNQTLRRAHDSMLQRIAAATELTDLTSAIDLGGMSTFAYEDALRDAENLTTVLEDCEAAEVALEPRAGSVLESLRAIRGSPSPVKLRHALDEARLLSVEALEIRLGERREGLKRTVELLCDEPWIGRLEEWRPGFARVMTELRDACDRTRWTEVRPILDELDAFLKARASHRMDVVHTAARAAGMHMGECVFDAVRSAFSAKVADEQGEFVQITERVDRWYELTSALMIFEGPHNWSGSQCIDGGLACILDQFREQGVSVEVYQDNRLLYSRGTPTAETQQKSRKGPLSH